MTVTTASDATEIDEIVVVRGATLHRLIEIIVLSNRGRGQSSRCVEGFELCKQMLVVTLVHRLRRWPNIGSTFRIYLVSSKITL